MTSPSQQPREIWEESTDMSYSSELQEVSRAVRSLEDMRVCMYVHTATQGHHA